MKCVADVWMMPPPNRSVTSITLSLTESDIEFLLLNRSSSKEKFASYLQVLPPMREVKLIRTVLIKGCICKSYYLSIKPITINNRV